MSLFGDAFDISAGATLGNLAVKTGYKATEEFLNAAEKNAYNKLRSESFDPVVRQDLNDIMVRGMLQEKNYPFLTDKVQKKDNFFTRHKALCIIIIAFYLFGAYGRDIVDTSTMVDVTYFLVALLLICIFAIICKKIKRGKKKLMESGYKPKLIKDGQQYWHVREYIRQALASGQMSVQDAIIKISNTELGRQFPDTVDEIEANAFFYRQKLGL